MIEEIDFTIVFPNGKEEIWKFPKLLWVVIEDQAKKHNMTTEEYFIKTLTEILENESK